MAGTRDIGVSAGAGSNPAPLYENSWALVIGINRYREAAIPALDFAEDDAAAMAGLLPALGFPAANIFTMLGSRERITPAAINRLIEHELNPRMSADDRLLVFFAGHGVSCQIHGQTTGYLLLSDSTLHCEFPDAGRPHLSKMPADAYEMGAFMSHVKNLPAKHKLLLIDSCFSGFAAEARAIENGAVNDRLVDLWSREPVVQVLTAGTSGQKAFEGQRYGHGLFTWFVLKGLQGAASPRGDGLITFYDLVSYVQRSVASQGKEQTPKAASDGDGVFLFRTESASAAAPAMPPLRAVPPVSVRRPPLARAVLPLFIVLLVAAVAAISWKLASGRKAALPPVPPASSAQAVPKTEPGKSPAVAPASTSGNCSPIISGTVSGTSITCDGGKKSDTGTKKEEK